ncbi:uncharacterized protein LOC132708696 [Cylas formicarius]|uniref:uncharacterized protein LOC132708696 n=1 Tax=Cylas formicarius TaxID=197179 RepID=UPI002958525D|nr:uncharacterized protein LOC132708696 [Cylas formicarius]
MGGCRCSYKNCKNTTKTTDNMHFFHYPVKQKERCIKWIENACKPKFFELEEEQLRNKVVCEVHFENKWFPNLQRKRLIQGAIPTLDGDSEDDHPENADVPVFIAAPNPYSSQYSDVHVLPANDDGTVFVLDTENMYSRVQKVESYIIKNGILVPSNSNPTVKPSIPVVPKSISTTKASTSNTVSNIFYSSAEMEVEHLPQSKPTSDVSPKVDSLIKHEVVETPEASYGLRSQKKVILNIDAGVNQEKQQNCNIIPLHNGTEKRRNSSHHRCLPQKPVFGRSYLRQIKQHSRDIAYIKRMLRSRANEQKPDSNVILKTLEGKIPPTLHTMLSLVLGEKNNLTEDDIEFFTTLHRVSPDMYQLLAGKYKWNLPRVDVDEAPDE